MDTKRERALALIARISGTEVEALRPEDDLMVDLGVSSPAGLELLVELEEILGVEISDDDADALRSVGDILAIVDGCR